jgi:hypothetical protein
MRLNRCAFKHQGTRQWILCSLVLLTRVRVSEALPLRPSPRLLDPLEARGCQGRGGCRPPSSAHEPCPGPLSSRHRSPMCTEDLELRAIWWALEDLNLRPLPCQRRPREASDQHFLGSGHLQHVARVPSSTACFGRLLDQLLTILGARYLRLAPHRRCGSATSETILAPTAMALAGANRGSGSGEREPRGMSGRANRR